MIRRMVRRGRRRKNKKKKKKTKKKTTTKKKKNKTKTKNNKNKTTKKKETKKKKKTKKNLHLQCDWWSIQLVLKYNKTRQFLRQLRLWWPILVGLLTATLLYLICGTLVVRPKLRQTGLVAVATRSTFK